MERQDEIKGFIVYTPTTKPDAKEESTVTLAP
jgi:phospholipase C